MGFKITEFSFNLPWGLGGVTVLRTQAQQKAAWALYVELATRTSSQPLDPQYASAREALSSLYKLFDVVRDVLKEQGPSVAEGPHSVGPLAIHLLNQGIRPFISKWHAKLSTFEVEQRLAQQGSGASESYVDESKWGARNDFFEELETRRQGLLQYVDVFAQLAGIRD